MHVAHIYTYSQDDIALPGGNIEVLSPSPLRVQRERTNELWSDRTFLLTTEMQTYASFVPEGAVSEVHKYKPVKGRAGVGGRH